MKNLMAEGVEHFVVEGVGLLARADCREAMVDYHVGVEGSHEAKAAATGSC
jgi:hypothetical protein